MDSKFSQVAARLIRGPLGKHKSAAISASNLAGDLKWYQQAVRNIFKVGHPDVIIISSTLDKSTTLNLASNSKSNNDQKVTLIVLQENEFKSVDLHKELQEHCDVSFIDPHPTLLDQSKQGDLYWSDTGLWTPHSHTIVGRVIADVIVAKHATSA